MCADSQRAERRSDADGTGRGSSTAYGVLREASFGRRLYRSLGQGAVYSLAHRIDEGTPYADTTSPFSMRRRRTHADPFDGGPFREAAEIMELSCHMATHLEALCHVAEVEDGTPTLYGGTEAASTHVGEGFGELGIERCPPIIARGVMLDLPATLDVEMLPDSYGVGVDVIEASLGASDLEIQEGDAVLIRTGFSKLRDVDRGRFLTVGPGPTPEACRWLADQGISLTGSDTMSYEQVPSPHIGHLELIRRRGISLIKQLDLEGLARDGVHEFVLIVLPLKIAGATASPVNPIAIG
jgi:kynurenine formamidase